jgi:hypothetical protein
MPMRSRREFLSTTAVLTAAWAGGGPVLRSGVQAAEPAGVVDIGSRRELLKDADVYSLRFV